MRTLEHSVARPMGRVTRQHAPIWLVLAVALAAMPAAGESRVVDVRVGLHADHTRVVIELDGPGSHRIARGAKGEELSVVLDADGTRRRVMSKSPLVSAVVLEPREGGAIARIALREPGLEYTELRLQSPPRIVIDVRRGSLAGRKPAREGAAPVVALAAEPDAGLEVAEALSPDDPPAKPPASADTAPARDPFAPPAGYEALVAAQRGAGAGLAAEPASQPGSKALAEATPSMDAAPPVAAAAPAVVAAVPAKPPAPPLPVAPAPLPPVSAGAPARAAAPEGGQPLLGRLASVEPMPLLFLLAALVATWFVYRRIAVARTRRLALEGAENVEIFGDSSRRESLADEDPALASEPAGPPFSWEGSEQEPREARLEANPAEPLEEFVEPAVAAAVRVPAEESPCPAPAALALVPPSTEEETPEAPVAKGWQALAVPAAAPEAAEAHGHEELNLSAALVDRIGQLEARIEELRDARERLERFAAAQNEELRVQRAAIARTQRVLRGLSKPEDGAEVSPPAVE